VRRAALALLGTAIGSSLLVGAKLGTPAPAGVQDLAAGTAGGVAEEVEPEDQSDAVTETADPTASVSATASPPKRGAKTTAPSGTTTTRPTAATKTTAPKPPATGGLRNGTFAGAPSTNEFGTIKVTITVSGGKLTNVAASYPTSPSRTASINSRAIPTLRQEALSAQSAKIDTVSGATYTSGSYKISLQSALDRAKA
jgi:uncharacterized protein with FMN-binding domain